jgi:transposase
MIPVTPMPPTSTRRSLRRHPKPDRRRALELLAYCPRDGCTEAMMLAHGVSTAQIVELVRAGLAQMQEKRVVAEGKANKVVRIRITEAGHRLLDK